jgi:hypothetical protein
MILATQGDETDRWKPGQYLNNGVAGTAEGAIWNVKFKFLMTIIVPNILHTINLVWLSI